MNKYRNIKTEIDGINFASKAEAKRYGELKLLEKAGEIRNLGLQPEFLLQEQFVSSDGKKVRAITYRADFEYIDAKTGEHIVEDVKGMQTKEFQLKMKMFLKRYQQYKFLLT